MKQLLQTLTLGLTLTTALTACASKETPAPSATPTPAATATPAVTPAASTEPAAKTDGQAEMKTTASGLKYQDLIVGTGQRPLFGQTIRLRYTGWTEDGIKFDGNEDGVKPALEMKLGKGEVIKGWELGIGGGKDFEAMRVGGRRKLIVPPNLGYGSNPMGTIPPNSTLVFEVQLLGVKGSLFNTR